MYRRNTIKTNTIESLQLDVAKLKQEVHRAIYDPAGEPYDVYRLALIILNKLSLPNSDYIYDIGLAVIKDKLVSVMHNTLRTDADKLYRLNLTLKTIDALTKMLSE